MITINLILSSMLAMLIWIIQVVHYPSFRFVDEKLFSSFHSFHSRSISYLVMPLLILELIVTATLVSKLPTNLLVLASSFLAAGIWFITFFVSVPCHNILSKTHDSKTIEKLIKTNWIRTLLWTSKMVLAVYLYLEVTHE
jgi:hypothetical protein